MDILVVRANRRIGRHRLPLLKAAGHPPRAAVRNNSQRDELEALGAEIFEDDLEMPLSYTVDKNRACIFVAGFGSETGSEKTIGVDFHGAVSLIEPCESESVHRFIIRCSMNSTDPDSKPKRLQHYLTAKKGADNRLRKTPLDEALNSI